MAVFDEILRHNAGADSGSTPSGDHRAARRLCVITCVDPRLTRFFSGRLGLEQGDAVVIRVPGAAIPPDGTDLLRAVACAIFVNGCSEILVLPHTDCGLVVTDAGRLVDAMRSRGVGRERIPGDLRAFFGLQASPGNIARETAAAIRRAPFLPADVLVHAAVFDTSTGEISVVERGESHTAAPAAAAGAPSPRPPPPAPGGPSGTSGPVELEPPRIAFPDLALTPLSLDRTVLESSGIDLSPAVDVSTPAPVRTEPPAPLPRPPPRRSGPKGGPSGQRSAPSGPALSSQVETLRTFFRAELGSGSCAEVARALSEAFAAGAQNQALVQVAFRPLMEMGPKRYKVVDQALAVKSAVAGMDRNACRTILGELFR